MTDDDDVAEIEITSEMIDAGETVLLETLGGGVSCHWWPRDLAISVFRAMARQDIAAANSGDFAEENQITASTDVDYLLRIIRGLQAELGHTSRILWRVLDER